MFQLDLEQRQSLRFFHPFKVTDRDDKDFEMGFDGFDVNLTGLGFVVQDEDLFIPGQLLSVRVRNDSSGEDYLLEGVEVIHVQKHEDGFLCGCHISQVTSKQLLAHHRLVMTDQETALVSMQESRLSEFNFVEDGSPLSTDEADFQEASMALNLAVAQSEQNQKEMQSFIESVEGMFSAPLPTAARLMDIKEEFEDFKSYLQKMNETTVAFATLAKLLAHTPDVKEDKQAWQTMVADFEDRFLSEKQQIAYDFMHQGLSAHEALSLAEEYLMKQSSQENND